MKVKVKVKLTLYTAVKAGGIQAELYSFLYLGHPSTAFPQERPVTHRRGDWVHPRAGLDGGRLPLIVGEVEEIVCVGNDEKMWEMTRKGGKCTRKCGK
jgi:hypothetical protein